MASSGSQIDKPQRGRLKRAELPDQCEYKHGRAKHVNSERVSLNKSHNSRSTSQILPALLHNYHKISWWRFIFKEILFFALRVFLFALPCLVYLCFKSLICALLFFLYIVSILLCFTIFLSSV